jgi:ribosome-binding factor A
MAKKRFSRLNRVEDLIQAALAEIMLQHAEELKIGIVTVTGVAIAQDFSFAKVFVSVLDDANATAIIKTLNEVTKNFRYELAHAVKLRITPELRFVHDDSSARGNRISSLINHALKDDKLSDDE